MPRLSALILVWLPLPACSFAVDPVEVGNLDAAAFDQTVGPSDDLTVVDLTPLIEAGMDLSADLSCSFACTGACGQLNGCGVTCCAGSGCTSVSCDPECATTNGCGNACLAKTDGTPCAAGSCQSGACIATTTFSVFDRMGTAGSTTLATDPDELGMRFTYDRLGKVLKVRFLKPPGAAGPHIGHLWDAGGTLLGTVSFAGESASGWQEATFPSPIPIAASTQYVISYSEHGGFNFTTTYFNAARDVPPLHVPVAGGVYGTEGTFPNKTFQNSNYWVDVVVADGP